jgi:hypothetical protein
MPSALAISIRRALVAFPLRDAGAKRRIAPNPRPVLRTTLVLDAQHRLSFEP